MPPILSLQRLMALACLGLAFAASQAAPDSGTRVYEVLQRQGVLDPYFQDVVIEVAMPLAQAAGRFGGVQVNGPYRSGWLNLYQVDGQRLPSDQNLLDDIGFVNVNRDTLRSGALSYPPAAIVLLDTSGSKRLIAATMLRFSRQQPSILSAIATVDVDGIAAHRRYWDVTALSEDTQLNRNTGNLMRGALGYVLAHEIGHLLQPAAAAAAPESVLRVQRLAGLGARQRDEAAACAEFAAAESATQQAQERQADLTAARIIGGQCRIGENASNRHQILVLGMNWYLTAEMSDKLLDMGAVSKSALIRTYLTRELGASLYERTMAVRQARTMPGGGAVAVAYPPSHPPDAERIRLIEAALLQTPCGGSGMDSKQAKLIDDFRAQMCRGLVTNAPQR